MTRLIVAALLLLTLYLALTLDSPVLHPKSREEQELRPNEQQVGSMHAAVPMGGGASVNPVPVLLGVPA